MKNEIIRLASNGMSHAEIAKRVGCHPAYVRAALGRVRRAGEASKATDVAKSTKRPPEADPEPNKVMSVVGLTNTQAALASWLHSRGHTPERIAEVLCVKLSLARWYVNKITKAAA